MRDHRPALAPWPLEVLLGRIALECDRDRRVFDLPLTKIWRSTADVDLSTEVMGHPVATPLGPAAGPHTQLAQNIVLSWLTGGRTFELKTVQILDALDIPRPCIDMATAGTNVEWSQELCLEESLEEYAKAWLMLGMLREWDPLRSRLGDPGAHLFELSVGYNLEGLRSDRMAGFLDAVSDARSILDELRSRVPDPFSSLAEVELPSRLAHSATLSTFHGCPPDEIESIVQHLMVRHGLDVTVKLNPTLLGAERVGEILHDRLGWTDLRLVPSAFEEDLKWDRALEMLMDLDAFAQAEGRRFGVKLTNTLVVENHAGRMPGERMYLSGHPLHVISATILGELDWALPGLLRLGVRDDSPTPVAFSAGVDRDNVADLVGLGLEPVTVCSDLLRPGGYARQTLMLKSLTEAMRQAGCSDLKAWRAHCDARALADGFETSAAAYAARLATPEGAARYRADAVAPPKRNDGVLELWDCCSCNLCVTVCPNDAMIRLGSPPALDDMLEKSWQFLCLADLCNDCGNCTTFCPELGAPHLVKPRLHLTDRKWDGGQPGSYFLTPAPGGFVVAGDSFAGEVGAVVNGAKGLPVRPGDVDDFRP